VNHYKVIDECARVKLSPVQVVSPLLYDIIMDMNEQSLQAHQIYFRLSVTNPLALGLVLGVGAWFGL
jgi:hypothetical protein